MAMLAAGIHETLRRNSIPVRHHLRRVANGLVTILRGMAVLEFIGPEGYGIVTGALTMPVPPTSAMRRGR